MSRQWKKCARRSNFARLEQERAVLELKSYRGSSKLKSQKASINYVISPRRRFRTPSGKNQHSASFCSHLHLSSLIMEKTRTTMVVRVFLVAHWGTYGYIYIAVARCRGCVQNHGYLAQRECGKGFCCPVRGRGENCGCLAQRKCVAEF